MKWKQFPSQCLVALEESNRTAAQFAERKDKEEVQTVNKLCALWRPRWSVASLEVHWLGLEGFRFHFAAPLSFFLLLKLYRLL